MITLQPIKTLRDRRLSYLTALEKSYKELGYSTKLDGRRNILEIFEKGYIVPSDVKSQEEMIFEKYNG